MNIRKFFQGNKVVISLEDDLYNSYAKKIFSSEEDADAAIYLLRKWADGTFYADMVKVIIGTANYRG